MIQREARYCTTCGIDFHTIHQWTHMCGGTPTRCAYCGKQKHDGECTTESPEGVNLSLRTALGVDEASGESIGLLVVKIECQHCHRMTHVPNESVEMIRAHFHPSETPTP